jgi:hypothetical protein
MSNVAVPGLHNLLIYGRHVYTISKSSNGCRPDYRQHQQNTPIGYNHHQQQQPLLFSMKTSSSPQSYPQIPCVSINPLNAELIPICHLLILLKDSTFKGPCIVSISNKMQRYTVYLYMETALHVSGGSSTHHQERIQLYLQHLVFVTPLLLSADIVEELEPV